VTRLSDSLQFQHGPAWASRIALAPMTNRQSNDDGTISDAEINWLVARGHGGFGQVLTAAAYVSDAGRTWQGAFGISGDEHLPGLRKLADAMRATGTPIAVQLHHGGRRFLPELTDRPGQCPWDDPKHHAFAMSTAEIEEMIEDFAAGAYRAETAGCDGAEVHSAHGYLLGQFLDGRSNHRTDGYGGSFDARLRVVLEVLEAIRGSTGPNFQLGIRLTPEGFGIPLEEGREHVRQVLASGLVDYVDMSLWDVRARPRGGADGLLIDHFVDLPRTSTRIGVTGTIRSAAEAAWCLERGADFVSVGKAAIVHRDFAIRAVTDPSFESRELPVPRDTLAEQAVSPPFLKYLVEDFDGIVA
jgi:2,4-dienoyl-CoA reductase-like NADH-dependent reductase (Old Yellow Enzyme family)